MWNGKERRRVCPRCSPGRTTGYRPRPAVFDAFPYFRKNRTANTRVEKIKQPRAKLRSVFLEMVIMYLTAPDYR
jgi:hypothetical protein